MPLFWKPYKSDVTPVHRRAEGEASRRSRPSSAPAARCCGTGAIDREAQAECSEASVPQQPYVYQTKTAEPARGRRGHRRSPADPERPLPPSVVDRVAVARLYGEPLFAMPHGPLHPARRARGLSRSLRRPARPAAVPDPQAELQHPRHPAGRRDAPVPAPTSSRSARATSSSPAEYLLMAAMLIEIKSRMLLPPKKQRRRPGARRPARRTRAPAARIRADEARRRAARCAAAARPRLPARAGRDRAIARAALPRRASRPICATPGSTSCTRAKLKQHHTITREQLSVREHMSIVLRRLQGRRFVEFEELFDASARHAGGGRHLHRAARTGARKPARGDAGRGVRADLRAAGVPADVRRSTARVGVDLAGRAAPERAGATRLASVRARDQPPSPSALAITRNAPLTLR